jgi:hypothetical protein
MRFAAAMAPRFDGEHFVPEMSRVANGMTRSISISGSGPEHAAQARMDVTAPRRSRRCVSLHSVDERSDVGAHGAGLSCVVQ